MVHRYEGVKDVQTIEVVVRSLFSTLLLVTLACKVAGNLCTYVPFQPDNYAEPDFRRNKKIALALSSEALS